LSGNGVYQALTVRINDTVPYILRRRQVEGITMKWISAVLFMYVLLVCSGSSLAAQKINDIKPQVCTPDGANMKCVVNAYNIQSGTGKNFSAWYTLTSTAPKGFIFKWAEAWVSAPADHRCGVKSAESPIATEGPTKGYKTGTAYWAQCYIAEEDTTHVVAKVNIQGEEQRSFGSPDAPSWRLGNATLTAFYVPAPQSKATQLKQKQ
jgi:hypothetical protein